MSPVSTLTRRQFLEALGAGLLISVAPAPAQRRRSGRAPLTVGARLHLGTDGTVTVLTGKVEEGQGARAELTQAAAEELGLPARRVRLVMADTDLVPNDGITAGSRTTPSTVPAVRRGAATARTLLIAWAADRWQVPAETLSLGQGRITDPAGGRSLTYADLARAPQVESLWQRPVDDAVTITPLGHWQSLGNSLPRPNLRDLITGAHRFPSDVQPEGLWYGRVLRAPAYGVSLRSVDLAAAASLADVQVVREGDFVAVAAATNRRATEALEAIARTAVWTAVPEQPSSETVFAHLRAHARSGGRGRARERGDVTRAWAEAARTLEATYEVAYVQHAPLEPRAATALWAEGRLTVWTGVDNPQGVRSELAQALGVPAAQVRVIVPDMGGGFGGKHTGEAAVEAARLARACARPVAVHWTRAEEFTWAYFRPAAVIPCRAGLDRQGHLSVWEFTNINAGSSALDPPYEIPHQRTRSLGSESPLRQGSYRCLAATANNFARESFLDEAAAVGGVDPLAFRLAHLREARLRTVLEAAARRFDWARRRRDRAPDTGVGLACGTEKGSVVAACAQVRVDRERGVIVVQEVCEAFECGPVLNPANLRRQVEGCITMGLGPALWEAVAFRDGRVLTTDLYAYRVPRFRDLPRLDIHLVENRDIAPAGGGETPIIAVAPAVANAVYHAIGLRLRALPLEPALRAGLAAGGGAA